MHLGDVYLDGVDIMVVTNESNNYGITQDNIERSINKDAQFLVSWKDVLATFERTIVDAGRGYNYT